MIFWNIKRFALNTFIELVSILLARPKQINGQTKWEIENAGKEWEGTLLLRKDEGRKDKGQIPTHPKMTGNKWLKSTNCRKKSVKICNNNQRSVFIVLTTPYTVETLKKNIRNKILKVLAGQIGSFLFDFSVHLFLFTEWRDLKVVKNYENQLN